MLEVRYFQTLASAGQVSEDQSCEAEVPCGGKVDSNTFEPVTVVTSQHRCVSLADITIESIQNTSQQEAGVIIISEDELQRYVQTDTPHPKAKSRKKNNFSRQVFHHDCLLMMFCF